MKFKILNILVYLFLMINSGFENEQDSSANLGSQADQQPLKPLPFYFDFASRGFDVTTQSLFGDLSPGNLKGRIFKLDDIDGTPKLKSRKELRTRSELPKFSNDYNLTLANRRHLDFYNNIDNLNLLLDPSVAAFNPGNYSDQFGYLRYFPKLLFQNLVFIQNSYLEVTADVDEDFVNKLKGLPIEFNNKLYEDFIKFFGTHYFRRVDFGGVLRIRGRRKKALKEETDDDEIMMTNIQLYTNYLLNVFSGQANYTSSLGLATARYHFDTLRTYGGEKIDIIEFREQFLMSQLCRFKSNEKVAFLTEWIISLHDNSIPIGGEIEPIYNLAAFIKVDEQIVKNLEKATQNEFNKFKINSYIEAMNLALTANDDSIFKNFTKKFDIVGFKDYFSKKLLENDKILDEVFLDKCQSIDAYVEQWIKADLQFVLGDDCDEVY